MRTLRKIWSAILLVSLLGLAGCPEDMAQKGGDSSSGQSGGSAGD
jgi:hypothetical protein